MYGFSDLIKFHGPTVNLLYFDVVGILMVVLTAISIKIR